MPLQQKEVEDVFGGDEAWSNLPKTQGEPLIMCPLADPAQLLAQLLLMNCTSVLRRSLLQ